MLTWVGYGFFFSILLLFLQPGFSDLTEQGWCTPAVPPLCPPYWDHLRRKAERCAFMEDTRVRSFAPAEPHSAPCSDRSARHARAPRGCPRPRKTTGAPGNNGLGWGNHLQAGGGSSLCVLIVTGVKAFETMTKPCRNDWRWARAAGRSEQRNGKVQRGAGGRWAKNTTSVTPEPVLLNNINGAERKRSMYRKIAPAWKKRNKALENGVWLLGDCLSDRSPQAGASSFPGAPPSALRGGSRARTGGAARCPGRVSLGSPPSLEEARSWAVGGGRVLMPP